MTSHAEASGVLVKKVTSTFDIISFIVVLNVLWYIFMCKKMEVARLIEVVLCNE